MKLTFDNQFTRSLPADPESGSRRRQVANAIYSRVNPTPVTAPELVAHSAEALELVGLGDVDANSEAFTSVFSGSKLLADMDPHATCYGGHQFGNWAGQLGDGRAINLGEIETAQGLLMLQLKGAGATPYSRTADGLAVLRSSLREFLCSEAMFHLGIPTTRALSLIRSGEDVMRDMLYDGNAQLEPGAIVCRVSPSFVRFGHFQMLAARQETPLLARFTAFVIDTQFPEVANATRNQSDKERVIAFFRAVCQRTATLMVHWMRVGFVHGVMNTDNLSIIGETIDYGPYGWLDDFDPNWTPNTTDASQRRYRYGQQPGIAQWNLMQLGNALVSLVEESGPLEDCLSEFATLYSEQWLAMMASKLGLARADEALVSDLLTNLASAETDMSIFFRTLADAPPHLAVEGAVKAALYNESDWRAVEEQWQQWAQRYALASTESGLPGDQRKASMNANNPKYVLRNYLAQLAIDDAERGDYGKTSELLDVMRRPYDDQPQYEAEYAGKRPDWARSRVGCSQLSCSS
ncbi:MAG: YdiU family protein [Pseudomonadaceae bacterium]|nr:YdiU family protein [Pseudomonadaceae bacterium]